jgi:hypothetical protein
MRLFQTVLASVVACASLAQAESNSSVFSRIDDVRHSAADRLCKTVTTAGDRDNPVITLRCRPGPDNWPVEMLAADARTQVTFGKLADPRGGAIAALGGGFADPHHTIEWRLQSGKPVAVIHRYFLDNQRQALTIHKLNNSDRTSCVAAVVAVERGRDANAEAVKLADTIVPTFRCGHDKLLTVGQVAGL